MARALAPTLGVLLLVVGAGSVAFDRFVLRPEIVRFSRNR
jgi:hypothetical protein